MLGEVVNYPGPLVELPAAPPRPAGDLSLPLHRAEWLRPRRTGRGRLQGSSRRHGRDSARPRSCAGLRAGIRHVLSLGDSPPAGQPVHRFHVCGGAQVDAGSAQQGWRPADLPQGSHEKHRYPQHGRRAGEISSAAIRPPRWRGASVDQRRVRDLRPRQRHRLRPGDRRTRRPRPPLFPTEERTGDGARRDRLREGAAAASARLRARVRSVPARRT